MIRAETIPAARRRLSGRNALRALWILLNSVVGVVALFVLNWLHVFSPGVPITLGTVLVCAFGGLPGVAALVALHLLGLDI
jgi:pro-sigmaK processing inhibitor BofA